MNQRKSWPAPARRTFGVRARVLTIALVPSVTLLGIGAGTATYLLIHGHHTRQWAELASGTVDPAVLMVQTFQEERRLSILQLAGDESAAGYLVSARQHSDDVLTAVRARGQAASDMRTDMASDINGFDKLYAQLPVLRAGIDKRDIPGLTVVSSFGTIIDVVLTATVLSARAAPASDVTNKLFDSVDALRASEALSRAGALAAITEPMTAERFTEFVTRVGDLRSEINYATTNWRGPRLEQLQQIITSPAWKRITDYHNELIGRGPDERSARTIDDTGIQAALGELVPKLLELWRDQAHDAQAAAVSYADDVAEQSLLGGLGVLAATLAGLLAALLLANRLIERMRRLRTATLELADTSLPETMRKLERGELEQAESALEPLAFGIDEIGQVADAFNRAHAAAVSAAVSEARVRAGVSAVFVDIAQRSQVIVHRQLELLDAAESQEENPRQLELLFQLDHLTTRARRHAENLIILGGGRPGRTWRKPVPLIDIVRAALAESVDYRRIAISRQPDIHAVGTVVSDLIHIIAELMDNATAFSPPQSRVEVNGRIVGKGVAVEVVDQGLGMPSDRLDATNTLLADAPGFDLEAIGGGGRLGLFVIATLAARHGISVRLAESMYGGVCAIVLVPAGLLSTEAAAGPADSIPASVPARRGRTDETHVFVPPGTSPAVRTTEQQGPATVLERGDHRATRRRIESDSTTNGFGTSESAEEGKEGDDRRFGFPPS